MAPEITEITAASPWKEGLALVAPSRKEDLAVMAERYLAHAFLITGDRSVALDVVADVTLRILERRNQEEIENLNAFFRRSVINRAIDLSRRRARDFVPSTVAVRDFETRDVADTAVASVVVGQALRRISPKLRAVIVLRFFDDLSEAEIASTLDLPIGTVKSRIARGLQQLGQAISGHRNSDRKDGR